MFSVLLFCSLFFSQAAATSPVEPLVNGPENAPSCVSHEQWQSLLQELSETHRSVEQLRAKIDNLEKQQRDFLALMTDIVVQPQKGQAFQEQHDYEQALELMKMQQYLQALKIFTKFKEQYPQSDKLPYVYYWIAEISSVQQNYAEARSYYERLYQNFPRHVKASEALFKMGKIDYNEGLISSAENLWTEVILQYPQSQAAQFAKKSLKALYDEKISSNITENN